MNVTQFQQYFCIETLTVWPQMHAQLIAFDYITIRESARAEYTDCIWLYNH